MSIDQKIKNLRAALAELGQDTNQWTDADLLKVTLTGASRLPRWADQTPEQRLTECVARGERPETELLGEALNQAWAEARRHENAYTMLLQTQIQEHRAVRAAARRAALADITAQAGLYLQAILNRNASPIDGVIYRAEQIPENGRMPVAQARELREAALRARWLLKGVATESAIADARKDEGVQALEALKTELRRMQTVIGDVGRTLHIRYGKTTGTLCECPGCDLIRTVHDVKEADDGAPAGLGG